MELGIASVAAITAIAYLLGMAVKATSVADKWIPIICGAAGLILGVVAWAMGVPDFRRTTGSTPRPSASCPAGRRRALTRASSS